MSIDGLSQPHRPEFNVPQLHQQGSERDDRDVQLLEAWLPTFEVMNLNLRNQLPTLRRLANAPDEASASVILARFFHNEEISHENQLEKIYSLYAATNSLEYFPFEEELFSILLATGLDSRAAESVLDQFNRTHQRVASLTQQDIDHILESRSDIRRRMLPVESAPLAPADRVKLIGAWESVFEKALLFHRADICAVYQLPHDLSACDLLNFLIDNKHVNLKTQLYDFLKFFHTFHARAFFPTSNQLFHILIQTGVGPAFASNLTDQFMLLSSCLRLF